MLPETSQWHITMLVGGGIHAINKDRNYNGHVTPLWTLANQKKNPLCQHQIPKAFGSKTDQTDFMWFIKHIPGQERVATGRQELSPC
jgi:hypothetical protein